MRILLTNDDGITSFGITLLADSLRESGHRVFLVAPDKNRSGASHSIEFLSAPLKLKEIDKDNFTCSGTPADCIIVSLLGGIKELCICDENGNINMENAPDLVLSGINAGANLGTDINYSGTAAAARQGSFFGIPSIALSLVGNDKEWQWMPVVSYITEEISVFKSFWKKNSFVNINFPNSGKKPLSLVTVSPSMRYYNDYIVTFSPPEGGVYCFPKPGKASSIPEDGTDWAEVEKGNAALSLIHSQPVQMGTKGRE